MSISMKKGGILNAVLLCELTKLRHLDKLVICDAGFPIPKDATVVDVSLVGGVPDLMQTLKAVLNELIFDEYMIFANMKDRNPEGYREIKEMLVEQKSTEAEASQFRAAAKEAKLFIRTGELRPCSNLLLVSASGVPEVCEKFNVTIA